MGRASWGVQWRVAEIFEAKGGPLSTLELTALSYGVTAAEVTDDQLSSVRRALNALARKGALVEHRGYYDRVPRWPGRAEEMRVRAEDVKDPQTRAIMLKIAEHYEELEKRAEIRSAIRTA